MSSSPRLEGERAIPSSAALTRSFDLALAGFDLVSAGVGLVLAGVGTGRAREGGVNGEAYASIRYAHRESFSGRLNVVRIGRFVQQFCGSMIRKLQGSRKF
jgi:hypothetical protein